MTGPLLLLRAAANAYPRTVSTPDPATISGLTARWRADQITGVSTGGNVASWPDMSINGYTATQGNTSIQPTWQPTALGGKPVVRCNASGQPLNAAAPTGGTTQTVIAVINPTAVTGTYTIRGSDSSGGLQFRISNSTLGFVKESIADIGAGTTTLTAGVPVVVAGSYDSGTGAYAFYINGAAAGSGTNAQTLSAQPTRIGQNGAAAAENFSGDIAELLVYSRVLTAGDRSTFDGYAQRRYGITVTDYV